MTTKESFEALGYVQRARKIAEEGGNRPQIALLAAMLYIETGFLKTLVDSDDRKDMAKLPIGQHGFPELPTWLVHLKHAWTEYDSLRINKAAAGLPALNEMMNASPEGIRREADRAIKAFAHGKLLTEAVGSLGEAQKKCIQDLYLGKGAAQPIKTLPAYPGLLVATRDHTAFYEGGNSKNPVGYKYINATSSQRWVMGPHILGVDITNTGISDYFRIGGISRYDSSTDPTVSMLEEINNIPPNIRVLLAELDTTALGEENTAIFYESLLGLYKLSREIGNFYRSAINGNAKEEATIRISFEGWAYKLEDILKKVNDPNLKLKLENAYGLMMEPYKKETEVIAQSPTANSVALTKLPSIEHKPTELGKHLARLRQGLKK